MLELLPNLNDKEKIPLYMQIYKYIKDEILSGNIPSQTKLPSIRSLAKDLKLSKNTIESAYEQLIAEGYLKSKNRSGLYVEKLENGFNNLKNNRLNSYKEESNEDYEPIIKYDFSSGQIDLTSFPYTHFRKILGRCVDAYSKELLLYGDHKGDYGLRDEISKYIHHSRGVTCSPTQIIISSGTQQSLTLLAHILANIHLCIAFEEPSYLGAKAVFKHFNFNITPINLEVDGIDIKSLNESTSKIVYVTPSHQYPYGMVMPISKRLKLLQWAEEKDGIIIEDDYDGEFRYKGKPIPSLQGLDEIGRVVYLGSFSKSLMPSMRISYLVLTETLLNIYESQYKIYEQPVSRLLQKCLEIFMKEGYWEKHLRKSRVLYKKKQEILISSITKYLGKNVTIIGSDSGLHVLLKVNTKMNEQKLIKKALKAGVKVNPTSVNWINPSINSLPVIFIGFAGIKIGDIPNAIKTLKECWFQS
jgi:GntR family transcriptional regulator/MocR family aminotransferase